MKKQALLFLNKQAFASLLYPFFFKQQDKQSRSTALFNNKHSQAVMYNINFYRYIVYLEISIITIIPTLLCAEVVVELTH